MNYNYSFWMGERYTTLENKPLHKISMPGTHNSAASKMIFEKYQFTHKFFKLLQRFSGIFVIQDMIRLLSINQSMSIHEQLMLGIRYFDLRLTYNPVTEKFFFSHSFLNQTFEEVMNDFTRYFKDPRSKKEVIVIEIVLDYANRNNHNKEKFKQLMNKMTDFNSLVFFGNSPFSTYGDIVKSGKNIVIFSNKRVIDSPYTFDINKIQTSKWFEHPQTANDVLEAQITYVTENYNPSKFMQIKAQSSPNIPESIKYIVHLSILYVLLFLILFPFLIVLTITMYRSYRTSFSYTLSDHHLYSSMVSILSLIALFSISLVVLTLLFPSTKENAHELQKRVIPEVKSRMCHGKFHVSSIATDWPTNSFVKEVVEMNLL